MLKISILLFNDVEVLDFAGPFEVFSVANELHEYRLFDIKTVAIGQDTIIARNGLTVKADKIYPKAMDTDLLVVPGGYGIRACLEHVDLLEHLQLLKQNNKIIASVCTGALLLAKAGLLKHEIATTHHECVNELELLEPSLTVDTSRRFYDRGLVITAGGISAGLDMSLHLLARLASKAVCKKTMTYMEYKSEFFQL